MSFTTMSLAQKEKNKEYFDHINQVGKRRKKWPHFFFLLYQRGIVVKGIGEAPTIRNLSVKLF